MHDIRLLAAITIAMAATLAPFTAAAQNKAAVPYKVISTTDYIQSKNPKPGERQRVDVLTQDSEGARHVNGHLSAIPPGKPGEKPQYHYHAHRESLIQILSGDVTEMVEGKAVRLKPGDVIYIAPRSERAHV